MDKIKLTAAQLIKDAVKDIWNLSEFDTDFYLEILTYPPDESMGSLAFPCFKLSRYLKSSPNIISDKIASSVKSDSFSTVTSVNGYLNFSVSQAEYNRIICEILKTGDAYGSTGEGKGKTVVLDYSSPNISKPFHIGHLGTTVIGHSLKLIHEFEGYKCIGINHLGDWGTQNGKQIVAFKKWGNKDEVDKKGIDALVELYVKFHEEAEKDPSLNDLARQEFNKLENKDPENTELWKWFIEVSFKEYEKTYKQLSISFDSYNGESFYSDKMQPEIDKLRDMNLLKIDDGASVVDLSEYDMPPCLILKRDGSTLYPTRDIAAAVYRKNTYDFDKCIYVTSSAQSLHFAQWFKVVELMGYDWYDKLVHVPYGTVSIDGNKLATRSGNVILLRDLFKQSIEKVEQIMAEKDSLAKDDYETAEAIGVGAIIFHYLYNNRIKDINFNLENALSFEGNTGPYAQYTYARTCSILNKVDFDVSGCIDVSCEEEAKVVETLSKFSESVRSAMNEYEPSCITRYIISLCTAFNGFYHNCKILSEEDEKKRNTRINITKAVNTVLKKALNLICIKTPERI